MEASGIGGLRESFSLPWPRNTIGPLLIGIALSMTSLSLVPFSGFHIYAAFMQQTTNEIVGRSGGMEECSRGSGVAPPGCML
jgi:hypothetical protein